MKTPQFWQKNGWQATLLSPLSALYSSLSQLDHANKWRSAKKLPRPLIVVGNINMGGTGKTPITIAIVKALQARGIRVGVISRGYKRKSNQLVIATESSSVGQLGDEPFLIYQQTHVPIAVHHNRYKAGMALISLHPELQVIISDDGLQHYQLKREIEIAVVGQQGFGNGKIFPSGPLREPISRLQYVDFIINNSSSPTFLNTLHASRVTTPIFSSTQKISAAYSLATNEKIELKAFLGEKTHAVAGIAYPQHFFNMLRTHDLDIIEHPFPDHHTFSRSDLRNIGRPLLMTDKDATKCRHILTEDCWRVPLELELNSAFIDILLANIHYN